MADIKEELDRPEVHELRRALRAEQLQDNSRNDKGGNVDGGTTKGPA